MYRLLVLCVAISSIVTSTAHAQLDQVLRNLQQLVPNLNAPPQPPAPRPYQKPYASHPAQAYHAPPRAISSAENPSFDCTKANSPSEREICQDSDLALLDRQLAEKYHATLQQSSNPDLVTQQRGWREHRDQCGANPSCLRERMQQRIAELSTTARYATNSVDTRMTVVCGSGTGGFNVPTRICNTPDLAQQDHNLAAMVDVIMNSANRPAHFVDDQNAWIEKRDHCPPDRVECISQMYQTRLAELAMMQSNGAITNAAVTDVIKRWGIPTLVGMPYYPSGFQAGGHQMGELNTPMKLVVRGTITGPGDMARAAINQASPVARAWTRLAYAMGLAATPDINKLDDETLVNYACIFLSQSDQKALAGKSCDDLKLHRNPNNEFDLHDLAQAFKMRSLPGIIAAAPKLPFKLLIVQEIALPRYDLQNHRFIFHPYGDVSIRPSVFGSRSDADEHNLVWPTSEAEARRVTSRRASGEGDQHVFLATPLTITGTYQTSVASRYEISGDTGLPEGFVWRINSDDVQLYDDASLINLMYTFPTPKTPYPMIATPDAQTPKAAGPLVLNNEAAMLLLLHAGLVGADKVKWLEMAQARFSIEASLANASDWRRLDPWGVFFALPPFQQPDVVQAYRDWSLRRAAALPQDVAIITPGISSGQNVSIFSGMSAYPAPLNGKFDIDALANRGLSEANLLSSRLSFPGFDNKPVVVVLPQPRDKYSATLLHNTENIADSDQTDNVGPRTTIRFALDKIEALPTTGTVLIHVTPKSISVQNGATVMAAGEIPHVDWPAFHAPQPVEADLTALQRFTKGSYGTDVVGLRLGTPIADAEAVIEQEMQVAKTYTADSTIIENAPVWLKGHLFVSKDGKESIAVFEGANAIAPGRVAAIWRRIIVPINTQLPEDMRVPDVTEQVLRSMKKKYGEPVLNGVTTYTWSGKARAIQCQSGRDVAWETWFDGVTPVHIGAALKGAPEIQIQPHQSNIGPKSDYEHCGPTVRVRIGDGQSGGYALAGGAEMAVNVDAVDLGVLGSMQYPPVTMPPQAIPMKF
jgi:uncharacterized protein